MTQYSQAHSHIFFPDPQNNSLSDCTHLAVGAHQDDLEVMAGQGILECKDQGDKNFVGVTTTSGGGSARSGSYKNFTDEQMRELRKKEQIESAQLGRFQSIIQLGFESSQIKNGLNPELIKDLKEIILKTKPHVIYTHNLADKHQTHVAVSAHLVEALRQVNYKPQHFYGCEVWRGLDWLADENKVPLEITNPNLISQLIQCHKSQTAGGKRYDLATLGRMQANATFFESHQVDRMDHVWFAMDLVPLLENKELKLKDFINQHIDKLKNEIFLSLDHF